MKYFRIRLLSVALFLMIGWPDGWSLDAGVMYDTRLSLAQSFWKEIATDIRDSRIMYKLWNEPAESPPSDAVALYSQWFSLKPVWEMQIGVILSAGSSNICIVAGPGFASDLRGTATSPLSDPEVAWSIHIYPGGNVAAWQNSLGGIDAFAPVLVTEWGFDRDAEGAYYQGNPDTYGKAFREYLLEDRKLSSFAWGFCSAYPFMNMFTSSSYATTTEWGGFVKAYLSSPAAAASAKYPLEIRNSKGQTGNLYLFQLYGTDSRGDYAKLADGQNLSSFIVPDGWYLLNQNIQDGGRASGEGYTIMVNGVPITHRCKFLQADACGTFHEYVIPGLTVKDGSVISGLAP